jgi:predicted PurR-regulated permease PerM
MARVSPRSPPSQARSLFLGGAALLALYLFVLKELSGVTNAALLGFAGAVFAVMLDLPTARLAKRLPRPVAVILVLGGLGLALFLAARWVVPSLAYQFATLASQVPAGIDRLWTALRSSPVAARALPARIDFSHFGASVFGHFLPFLSGALSVMAGVGVVVIIGAFLCADPKGDLRTLDALVPARYHDRIHDALSRSARLLRYWMRGTLVTMAIVGVLTSLGLLAVGIRGWLALGFLSFGAVMVPYLGSAVVGVAIAGAGLADSPKRAVFAIAVYAVVQALLGAVIQPLVFRAALHTSPTLLLIFQFIMAASFGVLGVLLAQPLLAVLTIILETTRDERAKSTSDDSPPT